MQCKQYLQGINPRRQDGGGAGLLKLLKEVAGADVGVLGGQGANPAGGQLPTSGVNGVAVLGSKNLGIDAEVLAGGEAEGEDPGLGAEVLELVAVEELELGEGLLHLVDGAGAVDELEGVVGLGESVAGDEGEEGDGLTGTRGHFQEAVALGIQGSLQLHHVSVLLWVYVVVREVHRHVLYLELHASLSLSLPLSGFRLVLGSFGGGDLLSLFSVCESFLRGNQMKFNLKVFSVH